MGSSNTTCFVTNQTIAPRDKCRVLAIHQAASYRPVTLRHAAISSSQFGVSNSICHPHAFWVPVGEFLNAEYDDHGRVTLARTPLNWEHLMFLLGEICQRGAETLLGENSKHEKPFCLPTFIQENAPLVGEILRTPRQYPPEKSPQITDADTWSQILKCWGYVSTAAQKGRPFIAQRDHVLRPLQFAIVHEAAFTQLVQIGLGVNSVEAVVDKQKSIFDEVFERTNRLADERNLRSNICHGVLYSHLMCREFDSLDGHGGLRTGGNQELALGTLESMAEGRITPHQCFETLQEWMAARHALLALENLNLKLLPMVDAAQDYSNDIGQAYAKLVSDVCSEVTTERRRQSEE